MPRRLKVWCWLSLLLAAFCCRTDAPAERAADGGSDGGGEPITAPPLATHEHGLPLFHLGVSEQINDDEYTPATLTYAGREYGSARAKYRGSTSRSYPKRSFTLKLDKNERFTDEEHDLRSARRLVLISTFDDHSQIRQRLAFELWNRFDPEHIPIRHFNAIVYLNGSYHGIYVVTEHVDDDFLSQRGLPADVNMYKARMKEGNFRVTDRNQKPKRRLRAGYTKEAGTPKESEPDAYADLEALVSWVASSSDAAFRDELPARLAPELAHWLIFVTLCQAVDTTTKNYFLMHDARADAPDPRWRFTPWDFNASFGQGTSMQPRAPSYWPLARFGRSNGLFERIMREPTLREPLLARFREAMAGVWSEREIGLLLERYAGEVAYAAQFDELRWGAARHAHFAERSNWTSPAQELEYLRAWLPERLRLLRTELER